MSKDMVMFNLPDGTEVSNDPRFGLEEALEKSLASRPTTGSVGPTWDEQQAQILAEREAALNSTQPGVGPNATVDDPTAEVHGTMGPPAWRADKEARKEAEEAGGSPKSTTNDDPDPEDSNERVQELREAKDKAREAYQKAVDKLDEDGEGDPDEPYSEWTGKQLVVEIRKRNLDRDPEDYVVPDGNKVRDAAEALEADDEKLAAQQAGASATQSQA